MIRSFDGLGQVWRPVTPRNQFQATIPRAAVPHALPVELTRLMSTGLHLKMKLELRAIANSRRRTPAFAAGRPMSNRSL